MPITMYQASLPTFIQILQALSAVLDKAEAYATAKKFDSAVLVNARLAPDMFPLSRQVQVACDFAKGVAARLAGLEVPVWEDNEKTIGELKARIKKTIDYIGTVKAAQIDGSEGREIALKIGGKPLTVKGQPYLVEFAIPNFYFHVTCAYAILRHNGIELGKRDFLGKMPG